MQRREDLIWLTISVHCGRRPWWSRLAYTMAERKERGCVGWGGAEGWGRTDNACANWLSPFSSSILSALPVYGMAPDTLREDLP